MASFSANTLKHPEAKNPAALERIGIAKSRIQNILDRAIVAHPRTLEQKISDQGPTPLRVDPHLVRLAIKDLLETNRLKIHTHPSTSSHTWYSNISISAEEAKPVLDDIAPLYAQVAGSAFGQLTGYALELVIYRCLVQLRTSAARYNFQGHFKLHEPVDVTTGCYKKVQPPKTIDSHTAIKEADFLLFGHDCGVICIECKNYREWIYPHNTVIKELIVKAIQLNAVPLLIARRMHYTTMTNFLEPAGIIAHQTYHQYYPVHAPDVADRARNKSLLGFTDVRAKDQPEPRTTKFFSDHLPAITDRMAAKWQANKPVLHSFALGELNLSQLYTEIGSPAGGKWQNFDVPEPDFY